MENTKPNYKSYKDLDVYNVSMQLARECYSIASILPKEERYGLVSQIQRSAVSIPSNIAEGQGRGTFGEVRQFSRLALGSLAELETQLTLCKDFYPSIETASAHELIERCQRMLSKLLVAVREEHAEYGIDNSEFVNRQS